MAGSRGISETGFQPPREEQEITYACANSECGIHRDVGIDLRNGLRNAGPSGCDFLELRFRTDLSGCELVGCGPGDGGGAGAGGCVPVYAERDGDADGRGPGTGDGSRCVVDAAECVYRGEFQRGSGDDSGYADADGEYPGLCDDRRGEFRVQRDLLDAGCGDDVLDCGPGD